MKNTKIGNIRVFAIFLVVLGHSIIMYTGWNVVETTRTIPYIKILKRFINVIEMPLFMSVSGFVFFYSKKNHFFRFILNKAKRLLLPYICAGAFWMAPLRMIMHIKNWNDGYFENVWKNIILQKSVGHLWYLISLFLIFIVMYGIVKLLSKINGNGIHDLILLVGLLFVSYSAKDGLFFQFGGTAIKRTFYYLFWFFLGYLLNKYSAKFAKVENKLNICNFLMLAAFLAFFSLYNTNGGNVLYYLSAFTGVVSTYAIMPTKINRTFQFIEKNSYGLYLFHSPMVYITFSLFAESNPYLVVAGNVIILGLIAIGVTGFLRKTHLAFMIGERYQGKRVRYIKMLDTEVK